MKLKIIHYLNTMNARLFIDDKELEFITSFSIHGTIGQNMSLHVESGFPGYGFLEKTYELTDIEVVKGEGDDSMGLGREG